MHDKKQPIKTVNPFFLKEDKPFSTAHIPVLKIDFDSRVYGDEYTASQLEALKKFAEARGTEITDLQMQLDFCFLEFAPNRINEDEGGEI